MPDLAKIPDIIIFKFGVTKFKFSVTIFNTNSYLEIYICKIKPTSYEK